MNADLSSCKYVCTNDTINTARSRQIRSAYLISEVDINPWHFEQLFHDSGVAKAAGNLERSHGALHAGKINTTPIALMKRIVPRLAILVV